MHISFLKRLLSLVLVIAIISSPFLERSVSAMAIDSLATSINQTSNQMLEDGEPDPIPQSAEEVMYFGVVDKITEEGYLVSTIPVEITHGEQVYEQEQAYDIIDVHIKSFTDTVSLDGSEVLQPNTPVVVAGYEHDGIVEALVVGDMFAAEVVDGDASSGTIYDLAMTEADSKQTRAEDNNVSQIDAEQAQMLTTTDDEYPVTDKRMTTVSGEIGDASEGEYSFPTLNVGVLKIQMYAEYFAGAELKWNFPFEVRTNLYDPIQLLTWDDFLLKDGETQQERQDRLEERYAMMRVEVVPKEQEENETLHAEAGLNLRVGFKGEIIGHTFDAEIDLLRTAVSPLGIGDVGLGVQVGGKYAAPEFGERRGFGVKDDLRFDGSIVDCGVTGCTINMITEDAVGISLPFFETGILTFSMEITPAVIINGGWPTLTNWNATNGLTVEKYLQYDRFGDSSSISPVYLPGNDPLKTYDSLEDAFLLYVDERFVDNLDDGFDLSFEYSYDMGKMSVMFGLVYQVDISAKKFGIGGTIKLPLQMMELPIPFELNSDNGELSCKSQEVELSNCEQATFHFSKDSLLMPMEVEGTPLPAFSGIEYDSGPIKAEGGAGNVSLSPVGVLPNGLSWKRIDTDSNGNGIYSLTGVPDVREGIYPLNLKAVDKNGNVRSFQLELEVSKIYPETVDTEITVGQKWREQLRFMDANGDQQKQVSWQINGLPEGSYSIDYFGYLTIDTNELGPGDYSFTIQATLEDTTYLPQQVHQLHVEEREVIAGGKWYRRYAYIPLSFGDAVWHDQFGDLAAVQPSSGQLITINSDDYTDYTLWGKISHPYYSSLSYVYPQENSEEGWMYIFGGSSDFATSPSTTYKGDLYRFDRDGLTLLYEDQSDESSPSVFDAMTAAFPDGKLLIYGGAKNSTTFIPQSETWIYDPELNEFTQIHPDKNPGARYGSSSMVYVPELNKAVLIGHRGGGTNNPDGRIWLFDPETLQWETVDRDRYEIELSEKESTHVIYSHLEEKLYIVVTPDMGGSGTRLYSIEVNNGTLGSIIEESLPNESEDWSSYDGGFGYDEDKGTFNYISASTKDWYYKIPQAYSDKDELIANGLDQVNLSLNAGNYLMNPDEWWIDWKFDSGVNILQGTDVKRTSADEYGISSIGVTYEDLSLSEKTTSKLSIYAVNRTTNDSYLIAYALLSILPVPVDPSQSTIEMDELVQDYLYDSFDTSAWSKDKVVPFTVTLRSATGDPLPERKISVDEEESLRMYQEARASIYTGDLEAGYVERSTLEKGKKLLYLVGGNTEILPYASHVVTDENGEIRLYHVTDLPGPEEPGEYSFTLKTLDGWDTVMTSSMNYQYRDLEPERTSYAWTASMDERVDVEIGLKGLNSWFGCEPDDSSTCFELVEGELPKGVVFDPSKGVISGTPQETGIFNVSVSIPYETIPTVDVKLHIYEPLNLEQAYEDWTYYGKVGETYNASLDDEITGGFQPYQYELVDPESLPPGITFDADTGKLSGTFSEAGTYKVNFNIYDNEQADDPMQVSKQYIFSISEQEAINYAYMGPIEGMMVQYGSGIHLLHYPASPVGSTEGVFTPIEGAFFELMRPGHDQCR